MITYETPDTGNKPKEDSQEGHLLAGSSSWGHCLLELVGMLSFALSSLEERHGADCYSSR